MTSPKPSRRNKVDSKPNGETFRMLFTNHPTPMWVYDVKTLAFLDINNAALEKYGYTHDEFLALTIKDIRPADAKRVARLIDNIEQERPALQHSGEWHHRLKNGQIIDVEITSHTLEFEGHKAALVMAQDITERKQAEDALQHNRDLLFSLSLASQSVQQTRTPEDIYRVVGREIKALGCDMAIFTTSDDRKHLRTTHTTFVTGLLRTAEKLTGIRTQDYLLPIQPGSVFDRVLTSGSAEFLHQTSEDAAQVLPHALRPLAEQLVTFLKAERGIVASLRENGTTLGVLTMTGSKLEEGDVPAVEAFTAQVAISLKNARLTQQVQEELDERKRAEEALRQSEERFQLLFDKAPLGYQSLDSDGKFIDVNQAWLDMLGYTRDEVLGGWFGDFLAPEFVKGFRKRFQIFKAAGQIHSEFEMLHKNGNRLFIAFEGKIGYNLHGDFKQTHCILGDITESKQAEEKLIASEVRYRRLFEAARDGILILNAETGVIVDVNPFLCEMLGFSHEEICGKELWELGFFKDIAESKSNFLELQQKGYIRYDDLPLEVANGRKFYVEFISNVYHVNHHNVIQCNIRDITERRRAEDALRESERRFRALVENSSEEVSILAADGTLLYESPSSNPTLGYQPGEFLGRNLFKLIHPDDHERVENDLARLLNDSNLDHRDQFRLRHYDGTWRWVEAVGTNMLAEPSVGGIVINYHDITERKRTEEKLKESLSLLRIAEEAAKLGGWSIDLEENRATWSDEVAAIHETPAGFSPLVEEGINFYAPEWRERISQVFGDCAQKGIPYNEEMEIITAKGKRVWVQTIGEAVKDNKGKIIKVRGAFQDITERKQAEDVLKEYNLRLETAVEARTSELRDAQEKLVRQEKLALLGQLAGGVGHELRNPLAVINNALYYLKLVGANGNEKVKEYLGIIQSETRTAEKIITDLLDFARIKSVDKEPVSVDELIRRTLERFPAPASIQVTLEIPGGLPSVYVDPRQMEQVLGNLVVNACQAMTSGQTNGLTIDNQLLLSARTQDDMILIAVRDTGVGIPPENMNKLFEPLFTTKAKGIGLGLAVSQKLAEANGGRIEVESEVGRGSIFTLHLPIHKKSA